MGFRDVRALLRDSTFFYYRYVIATGGVTLETKLFYFFKKLSTVGFEPLTSDLPELRAYHLSQSVRHASADIFNQYQHSPINEFQLFLLFFFICFFDLQSSQSYL